jgi:signal transduction histidine kinase
MTQKERLSSLGRLSTVIAHEVRNPLMIIKAALHQLGRADLDQAGLREAAADIDGEVVRLNRIVNDVLDFARPIQFERAPVDLNALCRESATAAQAGPGARVDVTLDPRIPPITTDAGRLRLAMINLILNARDAVDGHPEGVSVETRLGTGWATVLISDRGPGIAPEHLGHIFDPYFTTKRGGTGLGLPISKNIVEGLGGTIAAASTPGRGTEIRLDLPLDAVRGAGAAVTSQELAV